MISEEKYFSYVQLTDQISLSGCIYFMRFWTLCTFQFFASKLWRHKFETHLIFLIKPLFLHEQIVKAKILISWERRGLWRWNKRHFSSFLKGFHWSILKKCFARWESDYKIFSSGYNVTHYSKQLSRRNIRKFNIFFTFCFCCWTKRVVEVADS